MPTIRSLPISLSRRIATAALLACAIAPALAKDGGSGGGGGTTTVTAYSVRNLVSNGVLDTPYRDPNMVNTWGVAFNPVGLVWVTNARTGTSTLYDGNGVPNPLVVKVPAATGSGIGSPTGIVFSGSGDFVVGNGTTTGPSRFIFSSEDGVITGWAPNVDLLNAIRVAVTPGANYKGLAVATSATGARLYATDFAQGRVDMFDSQFRKVAATGAFVDPALPADLYPFGIQAIANKVYVTYARHGGGLSGRASDGAARGGDGGGSGNVDSVIDIFDADGRFIRRAATASAAKQPWGVAIAPADFGPYANRLLIGDFHDGTISAYDQNSGAFLGLLADAKGDAIRIPGLWGFQFGNGVNAQPTNVLFFAAGPNGMGGGVYGSVSVSTTVKPK